MKHARQHPYRHVSLFESLKLVLTTFGGRRELEYACSRLEDKTSYRIPPRSLLPDTPVFELAICAPVTIAFWIQRLITAFWRFDQDISPKP